MSPTEIGGILGGVLITVFAVVAGLSKLLISKDPKAPLSCPFRGDLRDWKQLAEQIVALQREGVVLQRESRDELHELRSDLKVQAIRIDQLFEQGR